MRRYNNSQSEVRVKLAFQGNAEEEMAKLLASLGGGDLPAIVYLNEENAQRLIDSGAITPVQEFIDREKYDLSDFAPKVIQYYTVDGKLWAMPFASNVPMLVLQQGHLPRGGPRPGETPKGHRGTAAGLGEDGEARLPWQPDPHRPGHQSHRLASGPPPFRSTATSMSNNENGRAGRATEVLFNGPTGQTYFQWWRDMVKEGLAMNVGLDPTGADTYLAVGAGRVGMTTGDSVALRSVVDALEGGLAQMDVELGVANRPGVPGGTGLPGIYGRALWIFKSRPKEEQEAAWKFIKWLMEPEQQAEWYAGSGFLPVNIRRSSCRRPRRSRRSTPSSRSPPTSTWLPPSRRSPWALSSAHSSTSARSSVGDRGDAGGKQGPHRRHQRRGQGGQRPHRGVQPAYPVRSLGHTDL